MQNPYVYVLVRQDLSVQQQAVQSAHAVLEMSRTAWSHPKDHPHLIILGVKNEKQLKEVAADLTVNTKTPFTMFREPDIGNQCTALATDYIYGMDRAYFKKFKLINGTSTSKEGSY